MILTDTDRRRVLGHYRRLRAKSPNPPAQVMGIIRDCAADWVCRDVAAGREPRPEDVRDWAVAAEYCQSMPGRPAHWWLAPQ